MRMGFTTWRCTGFSRLVKWLDGGVSSVTSSIRFATRLEERHLCYRIIINSFRVYNVPANPPHSWSYVWLPTGSLTVLISWSSCIRQLDASYVAALFDTYYHTIDAIPLTFFFLSKETGTVLRFRVD
ncbi:hypothetical protein GYMLUDRAFT_556204 [Collybiopsis luxurians FD-317 M1]|uniref:Uncharacterized protein n=1 Tax=Collybiopsis luxurians FD-317 M1 TaxID=944289 RepID=A0A0D0C2I0_9AGAR|nr:hypothetical protein GYMLUDRAFT_556204 [Collybiopsis luxurians FD-317 M1]